MVFSNMRLMLAEASMWELRFGAIFMLNNSVNFWGQERG